MRVQPKSPIRFDPDTLAPFIDREVSEKPKLRDGLRVYEIARDRLNGMTLKEISSKYGIHIEQVNRELKKALRGFVAYEEAHAKDSGELLKEE